MAVIKCKICGGDLELSADKTYGVCDHCGSMMTFPKIDDEQRAAAFNRGNHFRRIGEFDKALAVYERIVREDENDAEAHWCCALCRFGIEYVEDPTSFEWLPTCHRASFDSFLEDVDYLAALAHSDGLTRRQYQKDAAKIAEVQRGILATSQNTEPYDVFICYKESDENGRRTVDSTLAQDIYYQLTEQGRKVFFARITLEDVVGTQYEPYIFAALNSTKVMIVVGTKPEYLNAVWVRNEWSRFLAMMKKDHHKLLLPCYRDMDPYDLPEQLSVLQSYDMAKIGFIQDLIRGVAKVLDAERKPAAVKETTVVNNMPTNIAPLLKRAFMFLEDGEFDRADEFCEQILNMDPECAQAYLGKLMVQLKRKTPEELENCPLPFNANLNYQKIIRFGDDNLKAQLAGYIDRINLRRITEYYQSACQLMETHDENNLMKAAAQFEQLGNFKDAALKVSECKQQANSLRVERVYQEACRLMYANGLDNLKSASELFAQLGDYKDSAARMTVCGQHIERFRLTDAYDAAYSVMRSANKAQDFEQAAAMFDAIADFRDAATKRDQALQMAKKYAHNNAIKLKNKRKELTTKRIIRCVGALVLAMLCSMPMIVPIMSADVSATALCLCLLGVLWGVTLVYIFVSDRNNTYREAVEQMGKGDYCAALAAFQMLDGYKDSRELESMCQQLLSEASDAKNGASH